jgi:hypothetical protein
MFQEFVIADIEERLTLCANQAELEEQLGAAPINRTPKQRIF